MKINREKILGVLELVYPGISRKEDTDQSDCFAFKDGMVFTYNGGLSIRTESGFPKEMVGAIKAQVMLDHLRKLKVEEVEVEDQEDIFLVKGKGERIKFVKEKKFQLPIKDVETPENWKKLPEDFVEGLKVVQECAGSNQAEFVTVCIHIHPEWLEAFDTFQMCRYMVKTGFLNSTIVKRDFLKHIIGFDTTQFSETDRWVHFRNKSGLIVSCIKAVGEYPDISEFMDGDGVWSPIKIPDGLGDKVSSASISSASNSGYNHVRVVLDGEKKKVYVIGLGAASEYKGWKGIDYTGKQISFMISPKLLSSITSKYKECQITDGRLKVIGDNFVYCTCLSRVIENDLDGETKPKKKKFKEVLDGSSV